MQRRSPIFIAADPQLVSSGLQPDLHPLTKLLWADALNVTFFAGRIKRRKPGGLALAAGANPIRGISQQRSSDGVRWLWAASGGDVYRWYGPPKETILSGASWQQDETLTATATYWDFLHYGNWTIMNSSIGAAKIHKPPASPVTYGDAPTDVTRFMKKLSYVMAIGCGARGTQVRWSDSTNIEVFTATVENNAGGLSIDDFDTRIKAAANLGQAIAVYGEDQMALVNFINAPFYFGQKTVLDGIGAVGKLAVASDGRSNVGVGRGGVWMTDSITYRYIDEGFLHDYLQDNVNWLQSSKIQAMRNDYTGCFEFFFPMLGSNICNEGWSFDPRTGGWSKIPAVEMKDERRVFQYPLVGTNNGNILFDQYDPTSAAPLTLKTRPLLMQLQTAQGLTDIHNTSRVDEINLLAKAAVGVEYRIGGAQHQNDTPGWSPWIALEVGSKTESLPAIPDGIYWTLELRSTVVNWDLDLQGFMLFGIPEGTGRANQ